MALNPQRLLPPSKTSGAITKIASPGKLTANKTLSVIKVKVIDVSKILKGSVAVDKKLLDEKKREEGEERKAEQEDKLEKNLKDKDGKIPTPKNLPKLGFLEAIKRFIGNIILGYLAVRLIDHLPKLIPIFNGLAGIGDFLINTGIGLFNGLATFVDWGYKAYDATRGFIKQLGGENFAQGFDKFIGAIDTTLFLTSVLATDLAVEAMTGGGGSGGTEDLIKDKLTQQAASGATRVGGLSAGAVAGIVAGAGLLASALGEGAFQVRKFAVKPIQKLENDQKNDKNPLTRIGRGVLLNTVRPLYGLFQTVGFLLDVVGAPFRYAIELLRFPFLSPEDQQKQVTNLAKFDARIREDLRKALNMLTLGFAFKEKGSFGNIYGNTSAQKEMMGKMAGGGVTRGGRAMGGVRRTIGGEKKKGKYKRVLAKKPSKTEIKGGDQDPNKKLGEDLDKTNYFGPILAISAKIAAKQEPTAKDYENVGLGLNLLISKGIEEGQLKGGLVAAFANGGMVDSEFLNAAEKGSDISNWVARTFQGEIESKVEKNLRMIRERQDEKEKQATDKTTETDVPTGTGSLIGNTNAEKVFNFLIGAGFTEQAAAGVVGNLMQESGVNPGSHQMGGGPGRGIMQWGTGAGSGGRWDALSAWAASSGKDPWQLDTQVEWMMKEMRSYGTYNRLKGVTNVKKAVEIFESEMEKAGVPNYPRRYQYAADALASFGKGGAGGRGVEVDLGKGYGSKGGKIAGELGRYLQKNLRQGPDFQAVTEHPEHGGVRGTHAKNSYHYSGRAIDIGAYANEQPKILKAIAQFNKEKGVKPVELLKAGDPGHSDHVHVAYGKGGFARGLTKALLGERGVEFVLDTDTTRALEDNYPGFLKALNTANYDGAINVLRNYTDYESSGGGSEIVMVPVPVPTPVPIGGGVGRGAVLGGSSGAPNPISEHMYRNS